MWHLSRHTNTSNTGTRFSKIRIKRYGFTTSISSAARLYVHDVYYTRLAQWIHVRRNSRRPNSSSKTTRGHSWIDQSIRESRDTGLSRGQRARRPMEAVRAQREWAGVGEGARRRGRGVRGQRSSESVHEWHGRVRPGAAICACAGVCTKRSCENRGATADVTRYDIRGGSRACRNRAWVIP